MELLKQRYDCPRRIVSCHGLAIINYPKLTTCSPTALRDLTNIVRQNIDALNSLGEPTNASSLIFDFISTKLPDHVRQQWELTLTTDLLNYLENLTFTVFWGEADKITGTIQARPPIMSYRPWATLVGSFFFLSSLLTLVITN